MPQRPSRLALIVCSAFLLVPATAVATTGVTRTVRHVTIDGRAVIQVRHGDSQFFGRGSVSDFAGTSGRSALAAAPPATWCGTTRATDDITDELSDAPRFKVVYAYPSDQPNNLATYSALIQQSATWVDDSIGANGLRAPRFDYGLACDPQALDIATVKLPATAVHYQSLSVADAANELFDYMPTAVAGMQLANGPWNFLVFADGVTSGSSGRSFGQIYPDDKPGPANDNALGGNTAMIMGVGRPNFVATAGDAGLEYLKYSVTHEVGHTLGAVQDSATHSTGGFHCTDGLGIMCYDDDGPFGANYSQFVCAISGGVSTDYTGIPFDCNDDDYLSPDPPAGSYLSGHWNIFNSPFMCDVGVCTGREFKPTAHLLFDPQTPVPGQAVTVSGVLSTDPDANISSYSFDLAGNGSFDPASSLNSRTFTAPSALGAHSVGLTVTDSTRLTSTATATYTVVAPAPPPPPTPGPGTGTTTTSPTPTTPQTGTTPTITPDLHATPLLAGVAGVSHVKAGHLGAVTVTVACPAGGGHCKGTVRLRAAGRIRTVGYDVAAGKSKAVKVKRPAGVRVTRALKATVVLRDSANGKAVTRTVHLKP